VENAFVFAFEDFLEFGALVSDVLRFVKNQVGLFYIIGNAETDRPLLVIGA
jgi:hypothetical protein